MPKSPEFRLRPGSLSDLDALVALENAAFTTDHVSRRSFRRFLASPNAVLIVADHNGKLAGYVLVLFRPNSSTARLYSIAVAGASAGRGLGPALMEAAEAAARRHGAAVMRLEVEEGNARAIARYEKSGYRMFGRWHGYYDNGSHALRFDKQLVDASP